MWSFCTCSATLKPEEVAEAERLWLIEVQTQLSQDRHFNEWKKQFNLFNDEKGILRYGGRLSNAELQYGMKHPIFLSKQQHLALLIVRQAHDRVFHNGVRDTLTEVRSKYWIVRVRSLVKNVVQKCDLCKKFEGSLKEGLIGCCHHLRCQSLG